MESNETLNLNRDLAYVTAMAADFKTYLLGDLLYFQMSARGYTLPRGTLGGLFLRLHRLQALSAALDADQQGQLREAVTAVEAGLDQWTVQAEDKALREIKTRQDGWAQYVKELEDETKRYAGEYPTQAEGRTDLNLLIEYAGDALDTSDLAVMHGADSRLRGVTERGDFIWAEEMQIAFPAERFWWLYVHPRVDED